MNLLDVLENGRTVIDFAEHKSLGIVLAVSNTNDVHPYAIWSYRVGEPDSTAFGRYHADLAQAVQEFAEMKENLKRINVVGAA